MPDPAPATPAFSLPLDPSYLLSSKPNPVRANPAFPNLAANLYNLTFVMDTARIAELLEPFLAPIVMSGDFRYSEGAQAAGESAVLSLTQLENISTYIDILLRWNARINLTAIRDREDIVTRHFGESLFAARHLFPGARPALQVRDNPEETSTVAPGTLSVADIGSGAGFPGLPIKLWASNIALTLIESNHKKAAFLREVTRALTLTDVNIQNSRAEVLAGNSFGTISLRAVERFETVLPTAAALVAPAGRLALLISSAQQNQARSTLPTLNWSAPVQIPCSRARILLVGRN
ncbi:MAG TPA: 16S rRNA (guanine(527)-N(7))-methyltransferase RsmG [Candidatus Sulfotelmatobacter sp.]